MMQWPGLHSLRLKPAVLFRIVCWSQRWSRDVKDAQDDKGTVHRAASYLGALNVPRLDRTFRCPTIVIVVIVVVLVVGVALLYTGSGGFRWCAQWSTLSEQTPSTSSACWLEPRLLALRASFRLNTAASSSTSGCVSSSSSSSSSGPTPVLPSHDRPSDDLLLRSDFRSLSTRRVWNLFKLFRLPTAAEAGSDEPLAAFGGLHPELAFEGLDAISELCELREELRENCDRDARCDMYIGWLRCAGEPAMNPPSFPGDVDKLGPSDRELSDTLRERQLLWLEHSDIRRCRPL